MRKNQITTFTAALESSKQVLEFSRAVGLKVHFNLVRLSSCKNVFWFVLITVPVRCPRNCAEWSVPS